jgi:hypothetical protein
MNVPAFENTLDGALYFWAAVDRRRAEFFSTQKAMSPAELGVYWALLANGVQGPLFKGMACWLWQGPKCKRHGYGLLRRALMGTRRVHRAIYQLVFGVLPLKYDLDHLCRTRLCFNPFHVEPVTRRENALRGVGIAAVNASSITCPKGHPYSGGSPFWSRCVFAFEHPGECILRRVP